MRRREFIAGFGSAAALPLAARAQQDGRMRRVGMLLSGRSESDQPTQAGIAAFRNTLAKLGWCEDQNLRIDIRYGTGDPDRIRAHAAELVKLAPDVLVATGGAATRALQQQTRMIPIVIAGAGDVVDAGTVKNIARPEGNVTGVTNLFASIGSKWLELLKGAVPRLEQVAVLYNPSAVLYNPPVPGYVPPIEEAARALSVKVTKLPVHNGFDLVRGIDLFVAAPNGGLIILPPPPPPGDRDTIRQLVAQHRLPVMYHSEEYIVDGGLLSYGSDTAELFRRSSSFVDRVLRGAKVSELPVEYPTKFRLVINLKTARAIGLDVPASVLLRADEVIE